MAADGEGALRRQRIYKQRRDVLAEYSDSELLERYRFDQAGILFVTDLVKEEIQSATKRSQALTPVTKVTITLRYLATGRMQLCSADDFGVSQSTVSRVITETVEALSAPNIVSQFIKFPRSQAAVDRNVRHFQLISGFPGVVGAIDGTHVKIVAPTDNEPLYVNRHRYHSINVQVVCDASYCLLDIVAQWPGSTHDSRILQQSGLNQLFERGMVPQGCHMLGDSGYPCKTWLLTPYLPPRAQQQQLEEYKVNYNR